MNNHVPGTEVLIVGAGPTGLVLALWLKRRGIAVRIIDKTAEPGTTSRALVVHARTLELYRQLGLADQVVERGLKFTAVNLWVRGKAAARAELGDLGRGVTPFPELLIFPQDQHERLLIAHLQRAGVAVERRTELVGFEPRGEQIVARTKSADGVESVDEVAYLVGCDGAHSRVREVLGIGFPGGTYERVFYVADVEMSGPASTPELHLALDDADFLAVFPMKGVGAGRVIGAIRPQAEDRHDLSWEDVSARAVEEMRLNVTRVNWFSTYRVHHRVAETFRRGRVFLAGDAAHVHSPVGGQGMNTGIGDAVNLAWKLAEVLRARAGAALLASYEPERIAFAQRLVATTDRAFTLVSRDGWLARTVRMRLAPRLLPGLVQSPAVRRFMFRTISQTAITYRGSAVSQGKAGAIHGGDRLPWIAAADNFAPLASLDWQIHVYGEASAALRAVADTGGVPLQVFAWGADAKRAGVRRDAAYLVRPDGYVAVADPSASARPLGAYLHALR